MANTKIRTNKKKRVLKTYYIKGTNIPAYTKMVIYKKKDESSV